MTRYYLIFLNNDFTPRTIINESNFYGYSDEKELIKRFKSERNMNKFHILKKDLTPNDLHNIHYVNPSGYLELVDCNTKSTGDNVKSRISIVMTHGERLYITRMCQSTIFAELWNHTEFTPYILKQKYFDALKKIGYVDGFNMLNMSDTTPYSLCYSPVEGDLDVDMFNAFLYHFGDTLV